MTTFIPIEGIDSSHGGTPSVAAMNHHGWKFAGRYAVDDKSPVGRGITAAEYRKLVAGGFGTFLYWEGGESWMLGGFNAGVAGAHNGHANILQEGIPPTAPLIFAHDIQPQPSHYPAIAACLKGAESVVGFDRLGIYGGKDIIDYCRNHGLARFFVQTEAWSYRGGVLAVAEGIHLLQYGTTAQSGSIDVEGINVDLVRAYQANYGQVVPPIEPHDPAVPTVPWGPQDVGIVDWHGVKVRRFYGAATALRHVPIRVAADSSSAVIGTLDKGQEGIARGVFRNSSNRWILIDLGDKGVGRALLSAFEEKWPLP